VQADLQRWRGAERSAMARRKAVGLKRREMACETQKNHRTGETSDGSAGSVLRQTVGRGAEALKDKEEGESGPQTPALGKARRRSFYTRVRGRKRQVLYMQDGLKGGKDRKTVVKTVLPATDLHGDVEEQRGPFTES